MAPGRPHRRHGPGQGHPVSFGSVPAASYTIEDSKLIYVTPPAAVDANVSKVDVTVNGLSTDTNDNSGDANTGNNYAYTAGPVLDTVKTVDKNVEIAGSQLLGATAVLFGDTLVKVDKKVPATATKVTVKAPSLKGGQYDVSVIAPSGIGTLNAAWGAAPVLGKLYLASEYGTKGIKTVGRASAATGSVSTATGTATTAATGTVVIATGTGFSGLKSIKFGKAAASFAVVSDTVLRVRIPAMSADDSLDAKTLVTSLVYVVATNVSGSSKATGLKFQYDAMPTISTLSDTVGLTTSSTNTVTITGTHLDKAKVKIGKAAVKITETTATKLVLTVGKGSDSASEDVVITTTAGNVTAPAKYSWKAVDALTPYPTVG